MIQINISTQIYRPVKQVFDFMSAPENDHQWQSGTLQTVKLSEGLSEIGTFFRSIGHLMGRRNLSTFEITAYEPNKKYSFKSTSGPFDIQTAYTFEKATGGTNIKISTQASVINFFHTDESILKRKMENQLEENLATLKALLEVKRLQPIPQTR